jgi:hypothetical protein
MTKIAYEPHPVSPERKAELVAQGFRIVDVAFAPAGAVAAPVKAEEPEAEVEAEETPVVKYNAQRGRGKKG